MREKGRSITIIAALIGVIGTIIAAVIGVIWGKSNMNVVVQIDGKNIVLQDSDVQEMASENEELKKTIEVYEMQISDLENESKNLMEKLGVVSGELDDAPAIEFQDLGLSIDGEEQAVNKNKSYVSINGRDYYSGDFVDGLIPDNMSMINRDGTLYIGKIVKEKSNLLDKPMVDKGFDVFIYENVADTYGNVYSKAVCFYYNGRYIVFNANREYDKLKCVISMNEGSRGEGIIQIEADDSVVYTSPSVTSQTEPFEIDIPINRASKITLKSMGSESVSYVMLSDCILYNEE